MWLGLSISSELSIFIGGGGGEGTLASTLNYNYSHDMLIIYNFEPIYKQCIGMSVNISHRK
jgi:hypothetical protein